jgi:Skp family chaperone for outer membrane proteins
MAQLQQRTGQALQDLRDSAQARREALMAPFNQRISAVIEGVRAEYNYAFIFDVAAQGGGIVTADPALDVSRAVIQRLQSAQH